MRKGSQPSVNYSCCLSTVALANRDGTTRELFIPKVILLTVGNSGMVAGKTSFSSVVSSSLFTNSTLFFHAGILRISCPFAVRDLSPSQRALYYSFVPLAPLVDTSSAPSHPTRLLSSRALLNGGMPSPEGPESHM